MEKEPILELDNNRVERLYRVITALETQRPLNTNGPICIVAPRRVQRGWKYAWRSYMKWRKYQEQTTSRHVMYTTPDQFAQLCEPSVEPAPLTLFEQFDWVFMIDDVEPAAREVVRTAVKKLNPEQPHRMFMTTVL